MKEEDQSVLRCEGNSGRHLLVGFVTTATDGKNTNKPFQCYLFYYKLSHFSVLLVLEKYITFTQDPLGD